MAVGARMCTLLRCTRTCGPAAKEQVTVKKTRTCRKKFIQDADFLRCDQILEYKALKNSKDKNKGSRPHMPHMHTELIFPGAGSL